MTSDGHGQRIQELFLKAAELPPEEREAWLRDQVTGDPQLVENVRILLQYDNLPHDPLESGLALPPDVLPSILRQQKLPTLPGYKIIREIATGGQAIVYEAIQESTTQRVALKMLRWGQVASAQERERLRREVLILARLSHPGIVSIIDSGETDSGVFFIATEFIDGRSLDVLFDTSLSKRSVGAEGQDSILRVFAKICNAVAAAHRAGVVHRDLKPANIVLDGHNEPRVLDFGLAKPSLQEWLDSVAIQELTVNGQFMGSLPWASPEQAEGNEVDVRSDVYSLGVILYQLVSGGEFPYDISGSMHDVITKIIHADPTPLDQVTRDTRQVQTAPRAKLVDPKLNAIVMKTLAKSPAERYQSAAEFSEAVERYLGHGRDSGPAERIAGRRGNQNQFIAIAVGLSIVACSVVILDRISNTDQTSGKSSSTSLELDWKSFDQALSGVSDTDSITKTSDGWRIRGRELELPQLRSDHLVLRAVIRRNTTDLLTLRFLSPDGGDVTIHIARNDGNDADDISILIEGKEFMEDEIQRACSVETVLDVSVALLPDRVAVGIDGQILTQFHTRLEGQWTPVLDASSADIECIALEYCQPSATPAPYAVDVVPAEKAMIDYVLRYGGAAISQLTSQSAENSAFHITSLNTDGNQDGLSAHVVENVARCSKLKTLKVAWLADPAKAMRQIAGLKSLHQLGISDCPLDDDSIHHIAELHQLRSLVLSGMQIIDSDLQPLQRLAALETLDTSITVSDAQLDQLAKVKSLRTIFANGSEVTGSGFRSLTQMENLDWLALNSLKASGDGVRSLSQMPQLSWLNISESDICDDDIPQLSQMSGLDRLWIEDTRLTADGIARLKRSLPNCTIVADDDQ